MNEDDLARKITRQLNLGLSRMDDGVAGCLKDARQRALANYRAHQPALGLAWVSHGSARNWFSQHRWWLPLAALMLGLLAVNYLQAPQRQSCDTTDEVDAGLLASDLPIHAYTDTRFGAWLKASSEQ